MADWQGTSIQREQVKSPMREPAGAALPYSTLFAGGERGAPPLCPPPFGPAIQFQRGRARGARARARVPACAWVGCGIFECQPYIRRLSGFPLLTIITSAFIYAFDIYGLRDSEWPPSPFKWNLARLRLDLADAVFIVESRGRDFIGSASLAFSHYR